MTLIEILQKYPHWDSPEGGTDKNNIHDYINGFYEEAFAPYQDRELKLLEIGVREGASLALWREYFPNGKIYGVDVCSQDDLSPEFRRMTRVEFISYDAYSPEVYEKLPDFDIIIDDGPHTLDSMIKFIEHYLPKLLPGGLLIIEDVQDPAWFTALANELPESLWGSYECVDLRSRKGRYDDLMFVVRG